MSQEIMNGTDIVERSLDDFRNECCSGGTVINCSKSPITKECLAGLGWGFMAIVCCFILLLICVTSCSKPKKSRVIAIQGSFPAPGMRMTHSVCYVLECSHLGTQVSPKRMFLWLAKSSDGLVVVCDVDGYCSSIGGVATPLRSHGPGIYTMQPGMTFLHLKSTKIPTGLTNMDSSGNLVPNVQNIQSLLQSIRPSMKTVTVPASVRQETQKQLKAGGAPQVISVTEE